MIPPPGGAYFSTLNPAAKLGALLKTDGKNAEIDGVLLKLA